MGFSGQLHVSAALLPEKRPWKTLDWKIGGPQRLSRVCEEREIPVFAGNRTLAAQPVARRYTN
jgi:hypothetical protein